MLLMYAFSYLYNFSKPATHNKWSNSTCPYNHFLKVGVQIYNRAVISFISRSQLDSGFDKGGSFATYYKGELVVNIWGGWANEDADQSWEEDTMPTFHSATKSFSSIVI